MNDERYTKLCKYMDKMPVEWARRWCEPTSTGCACMGCCNNSGGLVSRGFTKAEWQEWWRRQAGQING